MRRGYHWLPNLINFNVTSESTLRYNCFAWALGDDSQWIAPIGHYDYWPKNIPNELTLNSITELFRQAGYELCEDGSLEYEYEKVAIYAKNGEPTHAARQLDDGRWTSKLGKYEDIEHGSPESLQGDGFGEYGSVVLFMSRPRSNPR